MLGALIKSFCCLSCDLQFYSRTSQYLISQQLTFHQSNPWHQSGERVKLVSAWSISEVFRVLALAPWLAWSFNVCGLYLAETVGWRSNVNSAEKCVVHVFAMSVCVCVCLLCLRVLCICCMCCLYLQCLCMLCHYTPYSCCSLPQLCIPEVFPEYAPSLYRMSRCTVECHGAQSNVTLCDPNVSDCRSSAQFFLATMTG